MSMDRDYTKSYQVTPTEAGGLIVRFAGGDGIPRIYRRAQDAPEWVLSALKGRPNSLGDYFIGPDLLRERKPRSGYTLVDKPDCVALIEHGGPAYRYKSMDHLPSWVMGDFYIGAEHISDGVFYLKPAAPLAAIKGHTL